MGLLWKKEANSDESSFIDLFTWENDDAKPYEVWEWDRKIKSSDWKHQVSKALYCHLETDPLKSNKISDFCLARADGIRTAHFDQKASFRPGLGLAIQLYNKCLQFAENGSENVSLSYANRAICFLYTEKYSECLKDIELAIAANHPPELLPDLMKLKKECLDKLDKLNEQKKQLSNIQMDDGSKNPRLDFRSHEKFPCMANVLEIQKNDEFGRHIVAKCDISIGKTVLVEENYLAQVSHNNCTQSHCSTCFTTERSFIPCPNCTDVMFCSEQCQKQNYLHQKFCGANFERMPNHIRFIIKSMLIAICAFTSVNEMMKFVENILAKRKTQIPEAANDAKSKYALFLNLKGSRMNQLDVETTYQVYTGILDIPSIKSMFDSMRSQRFLMHLAAEHVSIISSLIVSQKFSHNSKMYPPYTCTIASVYSFFNHSCSPNLYNFSVGNKVVCIALRPIKKGEQLFVNYLDIFRYGTVPYPTESRQIILLEKWGFNCKCDKCVPSCRSKHSEKMKSDENFQFLHRAQSNSNNEIKNRAELKSKCIDFLEKYSHIAWSKEIDLVSTIYSKCLLDEYPKSPGYFYYYY